MRPLRFRRNPLADDVAAALALETGERVLASARIRGSGSAVATTSALHLPAAAGGTYERVPWHLVLSAAWDDEQEALRIQVADEQGRAGLLLGLEDPGLLPETVRERVQSTIVLSQRVQLDGNRGVRVVARRVAGADELLWQVVPDAGINPANPRWRDAVAAAVTSARRQVDQ